MLSASVSDADEFPCTSNPYVHSMHCIHAMGLWPSLCIWKAVGLGHVQALSTALSTPSGSSVCQESLASRASRIRSPLPDSPRVMKARAKSATRNMQRAFSTSASQAPHLSARQSLQQSEGGSLAGSLMGHSDHAGLTPGPTPVPGTMNGPGGDEVTAMGAYPDITRIPSRDIWSGDGSDQATMAGRASASMRGQSLGGLSIFDTYHGGEEYEERGGENRLAHIVAARWDSGLDLSRQSPKQAVTPVWVQQAPPAH